MAGGGGGLRDAGAVYAGAGDDHVPALAHWALEPRNALDISRTAMVST